jgi:hypothetical protein
MSKKFVRVGERHQGFILCQIDSGIGAWICETTFNRKNSTPVQLMYNPRLEVVPGSPSSLGVWVEDSVSNTKPDTKQKPDQIYLVRYIRPKARGSEIIDNMRGTTLIIELDYNKKNISFQYSICEGDNFDKSYGIFVAQNRLADEGCYTISMKNGSVSKRGVVCDIIDELITGLRDNNLNIPVQDARKIVKMWGQA